MIDKKSAYLTQLETFVNEKASIEEIARYSYTFYLDEEIVNADLEALVKEMMGMDAGPEFEWPQEEIVQAIQRVKEKQPMNGDSNMTSELIYLEDLQSKRSPLVKKAAKKILKGRMPDYGPALQAALEREIQKPRAWETQQTLIYALAATDYVEALDYLKDLLQGEYQATVLYRDLALAIVYLENSRAVNLTSFERFLHASRSLTVAGACAGLCMRQVVLTSKQVDQVLALALAPEHLENFGQVINPIFFVLANSYYWSQADREKVIQACKEAGLDKHLLIQTYIQDLEAEKPLKGVRLF